MFTISHVAIAASTFLIVAGTLERFLQTSTLKVKMTQKVRILAAVVAIGLGLLTRGTIFYEVEVVVNENCSNLARFSADQSQLASNYWYRTVWMFYIRNIATVFLPFIVLAYMNISIVHKQRSQWESFDLHKLSQMSAKIVTEEKQKTYKSATRMMLLVVTMYLITNVPAVVVTAWEHIDKGSLVKKRKFHTLIADVISLLTVIASASRLLIYLWCNAQIRRELKALLTCRNRAGGDLKNPPLRKSGRRDWNRPQ